MGIFKNNIEGFKKGVEESANNRAMAEALALWGRVCGRQGACEECPIGTLRGANVTCQDFARQFPEKMLSILKEMDKGEITFYEEYCIRFPDANLPIEAVSACMCRRAVFEGVLDCDKSDDECRACWEEQYKGDVTMR